MSRILLLFRLGITGLLLMMWAVRPARADQYALLIGIDEYKDHNRINSLGAAAADAKAIAKTLHEVCGFPTDHIRLLTSDGDNKPERNNILFELDQLHKRVKANDTVLLFYSGHGMFLDGESYLVPYDADIRSDLTLRESTLQAKKLTDELNKLPAKSLILIFDMCRSDPRKGEKAITSRNNMGKQQARRLQVVAHRDSSGPQTTLTLYSCSPQQSSWEWVQKGRGYFSYFFEQGLRREAADAQGTVRVKNLVSYLEKAVSGAVQREEGQDQTPYSLIDGAGVMDLVLASGRPPGQGGATAVPAETGKTAEAQFESAFQKGAELYDQHRYDAARVMFEQALEIKPNSAVVVCGLGNVAMAEGKDAEAETLFRKSAALAPKYVAPLNNLGTLYARQQNYGEAVKALRQAIELAPGDARLLYNLGKVYVDTRDYDQAEKLFRKAIQLDPTSTGPVQLLGNIYFDRKDYAQAEKLYIKSFQLDPKNAEPVYNLGNIYFNKKDYDQAEKLYIRAIELEPKNTDPVYNLAHLYVVKGDYVSAAKLYRRGMEIDPKNAEPVFSLGNIYFNKRDYDQAEELYRKAIELEPKNAVYVSRLANLYLYAKKDEVGAERLYRRAIELDPKNAVLVSDFGDLYYNKKDYEQAEKMYRHAMELAPGYAVPVNYLGDIYLNKKDYAGAEEQYRKAIELDPKEGMYHANLARALLQQRKRADALAEARNAIALGYKGPHIVFDQLKLKP